MFHRPYFEAKARLNQSLDDQKRQIQLIEETIQMTKEGYSGSLKQLEKISEEIHERRRKESSKLSESSNNIDCLNYFFHLLYFNHFTIIIILIN